MTDLKTFIQDAREKELTDDEISEVLTNNGWDAATIRMALRGLELPSNDLSQRPPVSSTLHIHQPSLNPLIAALHHILLWFFTGSSTVTIIAVIASLFGTTVSSTALISMIAVTLVTFTPYAVLFIVYLYKLRSMPSLAPGKVWSIITICLHSIGAMVSAIVLITVFINNEETSIAVSAALILILNAIIVTAYTSAAFASERHQKVKKVVTWAYLPLLLLMLGTLFILSFVQLGPTRYDEQLRKDLALTVKNIHAYTSTHDALPSNSKSIITNSSISYRKKDITNYEVCATFKTNNRSSTKKYDYYSKPRSIDQMPSDAYVSESDFISPRGYHCFHFTSELFRQRNTASIP